MYNNKLDNLDETDKHSETHTLPKLTQEKTEKLNRPVTSKEIESVIKNFLLSHRPLLLSINTFYKEESFFNEMIYIQFEVQVLDQGNTRDG